jgi:hypothetical protein
MSSELDFPSQQDCQQIYDELCAAAEAKRHREIFLKLLTEPRGIKGAALASSLEPSVAEPTVRQVISKLRHALDELFFSDRGSGPFFIEIDKNPYKLRFWPEEELKTNAELRDRHPGLAKLYSSQPPATGAPNPETTRSADGISITTWSQEPFERLLQQIERRDGEEDLADDDDLRIATSAFPPDKYPELRLRDLLLSKHLRIKIILTNPDKRELIWSRNQARTDRERPQIALKSIEYQFGRLSDPSLFPASTPQGGTFQVKRSNLMPIGFYALTRRKALLGLLWSHASFSAGELIEIDSRCPLWETLRTDWNTRWKHDDHQAEREFNEFFGERAWSTSKRARRGVVILQSDRIEDLYEDISRSQEADLRRKKTTAPRQALESGHFRGPSRLFKARRWVNRCDGDGAQGIFGLFERYKINAPRLVFSDHNFSDSIAIGKAPFEITMGGFTSKTRTELNHIGKEWMQFKVREDSGDTLYLRKDLVLGSELDKVPVGDFFCLLPKGWSPSYVETWVNKIEAPNDYNVRDYAVILRHTIKPDYANEKGKVRFYLAGFTEVGTAAAGYFLASRWRELWNDFVVEGRGEGTQGDFLVVIEGESDPHMATGLWRIVESVKIPPKQNKQPSSTTNRSRGSR